MKVALCFLINYNNELKKEQIWRDWIEPNKDIIDVHIHFNKKIPIKSKWIHKHAIPMDFVIDTSYYHVVPAYLAVLQFAYNKNNQTQWFCMLTESCVPIISPDQFRRLFTDNHENTILSWRKAWWNVDFHKRANLRYFKPDMRIGHDPWFVLSRSDVLRIISYPINNQHVYHLICKGGLANESIFAMILHQNNTLEKVINYSSHITDWSKPSSSTSPYVFSKGDTGELQFIKDTIHKNKYAMFLRKIDYTFPDTTIKNIWNNNSQFKIEEKQLVSASQDIMWYIYTCLFFSSILSCSILFLF